MAPDAPTTIPSLEDELKAEEGVRSFPYRDSKGILTIGVGFNLESHGYSPDQIATLRHVGWSEAQIDAALIADVQHVKTFLNGHVPCYVYLGNCEPIRQRVLTDMAFNLGLGKFLTFNTFLQLVSNRQYAAAAADMLRTKWAEDVGPNRAGRLSKMMATGEYPL